MADQAPSWITHFPGLEALPADIKARLIKDSRLMRLPTNSRIFGPGQAPQNYLLLTAGTVLVRQLSETGREITLYRVSAGESCALTTACLMGYEDYQAEGIAETDIEAVAVPRATFDDLIASSPQFRRFVFTAFSMRITNLFKIIEEIAFQRLDIRLAQKLVERAGHADVVTTTHRQLASELGTAREVVSRLLHDFQQRGWITAGRGSLEIRDRPALTALSAEH